MVIKPVTPKEKKRPAGLRRKPAARKTPAATTTTVKKKPDMRWKNDEREVSRTYQEIDGPTENPALKMLQTSTGRLGHLNALRVDAASKTYMIEVKRRGLVAWLHKAWVLIQQKGRDFKVEPVLVLCMTDDQNSYEHEGKKYPCEDLHCVTASRHAQLLEYERQIIAMRDELNGVIDDTD